jgi:Uma2 family endonuclease
MPVMLIEKPAPYEATPNRKRWTRRECDFLRDNGLLTGRYELIDGEVFVKMGQKPPHSIAVVLIRNWLIAVFGAVFVLSQAPIDVAENDNDDNEPEPDAAVTAQPVTAYTEGHPGPADLLLVAEVSDTTLRFDRTTKAALYARAGICEYWVVDVVGRQVFVHRRPAAEGYADLVAYNADEEVATLARPDAPVRVADLLPPAG